jgi:hypothetical protein
MTSSGNLIKKTRQEENQDTSPVLRTPSPAGKGKFGTVVFAASLVFLLKIAIKFTTGL